MPDPCAWLPSQTFIPKRYNPGNLGNWSGHLPFARDLVLAVKPSILVELGTHLGESYFGFCQAIAENGIPCLAYAVDTWKGEAHAGFYDETVFEEVHPYNESNYRNFSYLLRSLFDDALRNFADDSIDILHIDGLHTFEAVSHDFYAWLPKVKPGGIILLHDVAVRHQDFGVWRLWDTLKTQGKTFEFRHGWGLGVFQKPGSQDSGSELLEAMFGDDEKTREQIRRCYSLLATELKYKHAIATSQEDTRLQVYLPLPDGYQEAHSQTVTVAPNRWQRVSVDLPEGITMGLLRLDLADRPAMIEVRGITLRSAVDGGALWNATGPDVDLLTPGGTLIPVKPTSNNGESNGARRFFSFGNDPQLYLPPLDPAKFDQPLTLEIWMRSQTTLDSLLPMLVEDVPVPQPSMNYSQEIEDLKSQLHALQNERDSERQLGSELQAAEGQLAAARLEREKLAAELDAAKGQLGVDRLEREKLAAELDAAKGQLGVDRLEREKLAAELQVAKGQLAAIRLEREELAAELQVAKGQLAAIRLEREELIQEINRKQTKIYLLEDLKETAKQAENKIDELEHGFARLNMAHTELQNSHRTLKEERDRLQATITNVLVSHSWRLTAPLRKVVESVRNKSDRTPLSK
jgi:hypothetical protein